MTGLVGADTDELRALAADFRSGADELRDLTAELARGIEAAHDWQGADATRCKDEWASFASGQLTGVSAALETAGALLEQNATEQDRASGETRPGAGWGWGLLDLIADAFPIGKFLMDGYGLAGKATLLGSFAAALLKPAAAGFAGLVRAENIINAMAAFNTKMISGGGGLFGLLGRLALPGTVWNGVQDALTGHGYSGWRGTGSRVFGAIGAASATVLIGGALGLVAGPALAVAGTGAVLYSAWSLGNFAWDHHGQAWDFTKRVVTGTWSPDGWARTQADQLGERVGNALDWARRQLAPTPAPAGAGS